jgi:hypothetical protein
MKWRRQPCSINEFVGYWRYLVVVGQGNHNPVERASEGERVSLICRIDLGSGVHTNVECLSQ